MVRQTRQSELLYNEELHKIYEITKNISPAIEPGSSGPITSQNGSLWLNGEDLKYYSPTGWSDLFSQKFQVICDMLSPVKPTSPVKGQLWLNSGIMMYYDGMDWYPVKAVAIDAEMSLLSFNKFLMLPTISGSLVDDAKQYLIPSLTFDRFFIDGVNRTDYTKLSDVSLQFPKAEVVDKNSTVVHVNPSSLAGIDRKLILIDKTETKPTIDASEENAELYGFVNGEGKLLIKDIDYVQGASGIELQSTAVAAYDMVLVVKYRFGIAKNDGSISTTDNILLNGTNGVSLTPVTDPICVFAQGMYLEPGQTGSENYTYDSSTGFLSIALDNGIDMSVISFPQRDDGFVTTENTESNGTLTGTVVLPRPYTKPLVFVSGETMSRLADVYTDGTIPNNELHIINAKTDMTFAVVEADELYVKEGIVGPDNKIPCELDEMYLNGRPILFVDGILISDSDVDWDANKGTISVQGLTQGQSYVLLKDMAAPNNRLLFDGSVSFFTVPTEVLDDAIVYMNNKLVCDMKTVQASSYPKSPSNNQIIQLTNPVGDNQWMQYNSKINQWSEITNATLLTALEQTGSVYSTGKKSINILKDYTGKSCKYYAYSFADAIEQPLLWGEIEGKGVAPHQYKVAFSSPYTPMANELSLWINGVRQYVPNTQISEVEINSSTFAIPADYDPPIESDPVISMLYVIEKREGQEKLSCVRDFITTNDRVDGTPNAYRTNISLYPGNLRVFIDGYRQPASSYRVLDSRTIMFNSFTSPLMEKPSAYEETQYEVLDNILIEVREDYSLRELTLEIDPGQNRWSSLENPALEDVINSKDLVMIYINGAAYGTDFSIDRDEKTITLRNEEVWRQLSKGSVSRADELLGIENPIPRDIITFEWR